MRSILLEGLCVLGVLLLGMIAFGALIHSLLAARRRRWDQPAPAGVIAGNGFPRPRPPSEPIPVVRPRVNSCPVCGTELPADTPEGLCPQCLMQCALSHSDHALPEEEGATTPHPSRPTAPTPAELAGHFPDLEILELLGQGGMGAVYKARQRKLDRLVAIKVLPPEWGSDPAFAERFAREARALARLNHPQVVSVHDFGEGGGHYFLIMEYVDGVNLRQLLAAGRLQPRQALSIVAQICDALQYAHEQGVVHRDIKPENILLDKRGRVKIADFGLAKLLRRARNEYTLTGSRQVMGTLDYMAPEQRSTPQTVDHRADIYSVGVVFYEMLTGELPLGRFAPPSERVSVDGRLDDVIFRALEREPERRYQRISAVKDDVESILRAECWAPAGAESPVRWEPDMTLVQLQTRGPAAGLVVVAVLILLQFAIWCVAFATEIAGRGHYRPPVEVEVIILLAAGGALALFGTIVAGAVKLARCQAYGWVMFTIILTMLPLGFHFPVGIAIGIWALMVLHKPEVRAAFALNLRRAERERMRRFPSLAESVTPQPAGPIHRKVRSLFLGVLSVFVPRSVLGRPAPAPESTGVGASPRSIIPDAGPRPVPAVVKRKRRLWPVWLALGVVLAGIVASLVLYQSRPYQSARNSRQPEWRLEGLQLGDLDVLTTTLRLSYDQRQNLQQILQAADREYLELELGHTRRSVNRAPGPHLLVTITPFPEEVNQLEDRFWSKLDTILQYYQKENAQKQLPPRGQLFQFGKEETTIEMWQEGTWYHWKVLGSAAVEGNGTQLPRKYERFWQGGPP
jgi:tRNA A-37 threonylcarbamoyl transferase component Bud32